MLVWGQTEGGHLCPVSMTYAAVPALSARPDAGRGVDAAPGRRRATTSACATPRPRRGCLAGMGMTEKQGGSDVRANTTRADA